MLLNGEDLCREVFQVTAANFDQMALQVFRFQASNNLVYAEYLHRLKIDPTQVNSVASIPFLPIGFFKTHSVYAATTPPEITFTSSGTTGMEVSKHLVADVEIYETSFRKAFTQFFESDQQHLPILALLPSYLERQGSSLIYMVDDLIQRSNHEDSGFYLHNLAELAEKLNILNAKKQPHLLLGVTYALLDLAEQFPATYPHTIIMETGGMKGKRKELVREELHELLTNAFGVASIASEYGMTELLSQAYSRGNGIFHCPPWMRVLTREMNDPFASAPLGKTGGLNVIDLANVYSCSFIETADLGKCYADHSFEILGRFDYSDVRGCNLLVQ